MGNYSPALDMKQAEVQSEKYFKEVLEQRFGKGNIEKAIGNFKKYDFKVSPSNKLYEVKADFANAKYGNVAIEGGTVSTKLAKSKSIHEIVLYPYTHIQPSGIISTKSDFYVLFILLQCGKFVIVEVPTLALIYYVVAFSHTVKFTRDDLSNVRSLNNLCRTNKFIKFALDNKFVDFDAGKILTKYVKNTPGIVYKNDSFVEKESDIVWGSNEEGDKKRDKTIDYGYILKMRSKLGYSI